MPPMTRPVKLREDSLTALLVNGDGNARGRTPCVQNDESYQECQCSVKSVSVFSYLTQLAEFSPFPISQDVTWPDRNQTRVKCVIMSWCLPSSHFPASSPWLTAWRECQKCVVLL